MYDGLKCLNYNGNITSMEAFENLSAPQEINIDIVSVEIIEVDEEKEFGIWKFRQGFYKFTRFVFNWLFHN